jgi:hypothetical protein
MTLILLIASTVLLAAETPADSKALIKITLTTRLVVTQCYSVVKYRPALRRPTWVEGSFQPPVLTCRISPTDDNKLLMTAFGGADRDRTGDPLVANQVLSQLSYSPL